MHKQMSSKFWFFKHFDFAYIASVPVFRLLIIYYLVYIYPLFLFLTVIFFAIQTLKGDEWNLVIFRKIESEIRAI